MFKNNDNPDYYNDAVKDARVNYNNQDNESHSKGKVLLILNLLLISTILGYFIYQNSKTKQETAVMGVNYTVDIREEKTPNTIIDNKSLPKEELSTNLEKLINNSTQNSSSYQEDTSYVKALDDELTGPTTKKDEPKQHNRELENILADIDTEGFSETTNVVKIDNEPEIDTELDINELANMVNSLVLEELSNSSSKPLSYEEQLEKIIPVN